MQSSDLALLKRIIIGLPGGVEVKRNTCYLDWLYKWEDGDQSVAGVDFKNNDVRRAGDGWMITLGEIPGAKGPEKLRVTLVDLHGMPADARPQMDKLLSSSLLTREQEAGLLVLAARLSAVNMLPKDYAAPRRK